MLKLYEKNKDGSVMEKKRSIGVTIFSWIFILQGINGILPRGEVNTFSVITGGWALAAGIGMLKLLNPARLGAIILYVFLAGYALFYTIALAMQYSINQYPESMIVSKALSLFIVSAVFLIVLTIFFTRPKVKEQFK